METGPFDPIVHFLIDFKGAYSASGALGGVCIHSESRMYLAVAFRYSTGLIDARRAWIMARRQASSQDDACPSANVTPVLLRVPVTL
ncbi:hypothetical protein D3C80_1974150 [compost metagenome]